MTERIKLRYVDKEKSTHWSYGTKTGNFIFDDDLLKRICNHDYYFKNFAFVERRTPYYVLIFDFAH